jgi:molecular chaperone GrpE
MNQNGNHEPVEPTTEDMAEQSPNAADTQPETAQNQAAEAEAATAADASADALRTEVAELKDKYLRLFAEFDNYKKRVTREKLDLMNTAAQDTLSALLPVLDDFDRAKRIADQENSPEPFSEGVQLLYQKIYNVLRHKGLEAFDSNGLPFDAEKHEAITEIPAPSDELRGKVVDTVEKGYTLHGKIIRYAKVVVGR